MTISFFNLLRICTQQYCYQVSLIILGIIGLEIFSAVVISILVRPIFSTRQVTPSPWDDASLEEEDILATMLESATRNEQAQLKVYCLKRDNYKCLVTGLYDPSAIGNILAEDSSESTMYTQLAHILPYSIGKWTDRTSEERIAQIWTALHKIFPQIKLSPSDINHPTNLMTLTAPLHMSFGDFTFALESTGNPDEYRCITFPGFQTSLNQHLPAPDARGERIVRFSKNTKIPQPDPNILEAHCSIAKILYASGTRRHVKEVMISRGKVKYLTTDGSMDIEYLLSVF